jgi:hypothetical protein
MQVNAIFGLGELVCSGKPSQNRNAQLLFIVIDWDGVEYLLSGMEKYRVDELIGDIPHKYEYKACHIKLREHFWECVLDHLRLKDSKVAEMRKRYKWVSSGARSFCERSERGKDIRALILGCTFKDGTVIQAPDRQMK